jgi:hypothetical protein
LIEREDAAMRRRRDGTFTLRTAAGGPDRSGSRLGNLKNLIHSIGRSVGNPHIFRTLFAISSIGDHGWSWPDHIDPCATSIGHTEHSVQKSRIFREKVLINRNRIVAA